MEEESKSDSVVSENISDENLEPCEEILDQHKKVTEDVVRTLNVIDYPLSSGGCVKCLDSQQVEEGIKGNKQGTGTCTAVLSHSDLIPNVYEGGLKVWECSVDLMEYLDRQAVPFNDKTVLELGSGAGLPGILAMTKGAKEVHFQDYNCEVIDSYTIPNVHLNRTNSVTCTCRYFSGDWSHFKDRALAENIKYDILLTSETIYKTENYSKLSTVFQRCLKHNGIVYLSAKSNYFGVGGGVYDFMDFMKNENIFTVDICHQIEEAVPRQILEIRWKQ